MFGEQAPPSDDGEGEEQAATLEQAAQLYTDALAAQRDGDWAEYGRLIEELGRVLDELAGPVAPSAEQTTTP